MPIYLLLLYLALGAAAVGGGGALLHNFQPDFEAETESADRSPSTAPGAPNEKQTRPESRAENTPSVQPPSFDVVRIERGGEGVIAGRAEPGWTVMVEADDKEIARASADGNGEWAVVLDEPLAPGEHALGLRAYDPQHNRGTVSDQKVAVSVAGAGQDDEPVIALSQPGQATRLLQSEPSPSTSTTGARTSDEGSREPPATPPGAAATSTSDQSPSDDSAVLAERRSPRPAGLPEKVISFDAVDYEVDKNGVGRLFLSGQAEAGTRVTLYLNNDIVGEAVSAADGTWTFESLRTLKPEELHTMRADAVQSDGQVASRAEVPFVPPVQQQPAAPNAAASEATDDQLAAAPELSSPALDSNEERETAAPVSEAVAAVPPVAVPSDKTETATAAPGGEPSEVKPVEPQDRVAASPQSSAPNSPATEGPDSRTRDTAARGDGLQETPSAVEPTPPDVAHTAALPAPAERKSSTDRQPTSAETAAKEQQQQPATMEAAKARAPSQASAEQSPPKRQKLRQIRSIVVRKGDTLWHIAKRRYGRGIRYTAIYRNNRRQIRNPHLIYPGQEFRLPDR